MSARLVVSAPAKLNLFLHVTGRREDGYHLLETLFCLLDHGDTVTLTLRDDGQICRNDDLPGVPTEQDLCVRAARLLQQASGCASGVDIGLVKRLPMGGGLGGGSSDAAAVLLGLNRLWRLGWSRQRLQTLALRLGADVPVFVFGQSAFARGIGEQLEPVCLPLGWYVVLEPPVEISTARIFASERLTRNSESVRMTDFSGGVRPDFSGGAPAQSQCLSLPAVQARTRNDLQQVACAEFPAVAEALQWLAQHAPARMTGSGACVFAWFDSEARARQVLAGLPAGMRGFVARGLDRHPQYDWAG